MHPTCTSGRGRRGGCERPSRGNAQFRLFLEARHRFCHSRLPAPEDFRAWRHWHRAPGGPGGLAFSRRDAIPGEYRRDPGSWSSPVLRLQSGRWTEANGSTNSAIGVAAPKSRLSRSSRGTSCSLPHIVETLSSAWASRIASSAYPGLSAALGKSVQKLAPGRIFTDKGEGAVLGHFARGGHQRVKREARTAAANADPFDPGFGQLLQCQ